MNDSPNKSSGNEHLILLFLFIAAVGWRLHQKYGFLVSEVWVSQSWKIVSICLVTSGFVFVFLVAVLWNRILRTSELSSVTQKDATSVFLGLDETGKEVHLKQASRISHAQVIGTTNAGKTESIILPWAIQDIENKSGLLIVDGKGDKSFLNKLYAYVVKAGRAKDFRLFSLVHIDPSSTFNPLVGGTAAEIAQRVFSSFPIDHPHYRAVQSNMFQALLTLIMDKEAVPTFHLVHRMLADKATLAQWLKDYERTNESNFLYLEAFNNLPSNERNREVSGLDANLMHFVTGVSAPLFNTEKPQINFEEVLNDKLICYFQLPSMYCPFLAEATGKLVLQSFQQAVSKLQVTGQGEPSFFSCFVDDIQDYIYSGFSALLNKARSANVGVVLSHQALGDLDKVGPDFRNVVATCTNIKVIMRTTEPETCDYYAKTFGTRKAEKVTERQKRSLLFTTKTGDGSAREVEQYIFHPNLMREMERGQGIITIPHPKGIKGQIVRFRMRPNIASVALPTVPKVS